MKNQKNLNARQPTEAGSPLSAQKPLGQEETSREASERGHTGSLWEKSVPLAEAARLEIPWPADADMTLPEQFFRAANQSFAVWTGERRLLFAVLEEAVASFFRYRNATTRRGQRLFNETVEWFWDRDQKWLYSFETVCQHLGLDAEYIRGGLHCLCNMETGKAITAFSVRIGKRRCQTNRSFAHAA
ncbi:MAG: hypothetical protein AB7P69_09715 [Candidatus Binatia bacterium]